VKTLNLFCVAVVDVIKVTNGIFAADHKVWYLIYNSTVLFGVSNVAF
jgi:hypothetical protein